MYFVVSLFFNPSSLAAASLLTISDMKSNNSWLFQNTQFIKESLNIFKLEKSPLCVKNILIQIKILNLGEEKLFIIWEKIIAF